MARYFKTVEIDHDEFISVVGTELDCTQCTCVEADGTAYIAVDENEADSFTLYLMEFDPAAERKEGESN